MKMHNIQLSPNCCLPDGMSTLQMGDSTFFSASITVKNSPRTGAENWTQLECYKYKLFKKILPSFSAKLKWVVNKKSLLKAASKESDDLLNDTPTSSPSPQADMVVRWVCHFSVLTPLNQHI